MEPKRAKFTNLISAVLDAPEKVRAGAPRLYLAALGALTLAFVLAAFPKYHVDDHQVRLFVDRAKKELGYAYVVSIQETVPFPWVMRSTGDSLEDSRISQLRLFENGKPIGPAHSTRPDIRSKGAGRYSHWGDELYFSASDNSDPRTNGYIYTAVYGLSIRRRGYAAYLVILAFAALPYYRRHLQQVASFTWRALKPSPEAELERGITPGGRSRRWVVLVKSASRWALILAITLGGVEIGSYLYLRVASDLPLERYIPFLHSPYRGHRLKPAGQYASPDHSPDGFRRDTAVSLEKPPDTMRIFALGGSQLYGIGAGGDYPVVPPLTNAESIDHQLETMINERLAATGSGKKVEVINASVIGYHTFQHLVYVNERLVHYRPDFFVFLDGHNDFYNVNKGYNHWLAYPFYSVVVSDMINEPTLLYSSYLLFKSLPQQSNFVTLVHRILHKRMQIALNDLAQKPCCRGKAYPPDELRAGYKEFAESTYLRAYRQIRVVADQIGAGMIVFVQPEIVLENLDDLSPEDRKLQQIAAASWKNYQESMRTKYSFILPTFEGTGFEVYGLGAIADKAKRKEQLYIDYTHLSPAGARLVAESMFERIWPYILSWVHTGNPKKRWPPVVKAN